MNIALLCDRFGFDSRVRAAARRASDRTASLLYPAQDAVAANVLAAFVEEGVAESDLWGGMGYGYDDAARERYESLLCRIFCAERALARLSLVSGTQAIVAAVAALVPPGKTLLCVTGAPYDTLRNAIRDAPGALCKDGMGYREIPLQDGAIDIEAATNVLDDVAAVFIQRSRGYAPRASLDVAECVRACGAFKRAAAHVVTIVDDCYGELVEEREPTQAGADIVAGSLIKNLGGAIAPGGAYVAGRADLIERVAERHYAPGIGSKIGPMLGYGRSLLQGLFCAPLAVAQSLRGLDFTAGLFEELGYDVDPRPGAKRTDIVQAIRLGDEQSLLDFARGFQRALPVNARFRPQPGAVPGYDVPVIMSSGAFVTGSTMELSCDAPMRPPFEVYVQGGTSAEHGALGALFAADSVVRRSANAKSL